MFFPNKCGVCGEIRNLKKCSRCNLISYCGEEHQRHHLKDHKKICKIVAEILRDLKISHIFENSRDLDKESWVRSRENAIQKVSQTLGRNLEEDEKSLFQMPRCCLVCYETKNSELINCPSCPYASLCKSHRNDFRHERDCLQMKKCYLIGSYNLMSGPETNNDAIFSILQTQFKKMQPPLNMRHFMDEQVEGVTEIDETLKLIASEYLTVPLTLYNALKKLNICHTYNLTLHVGGTEFPFRNVQVWETFLHLLPNLKKLQVVYIGQKFEAYQVMLSLCNLCTENRKSCMIDVVNLSYKHYFSSGYFRKPDLVAFLNLELPFENFQAREEFETNVVVTCSRVPCWLVITATTESKMLLAGKEFQTASCFREIIRDDYNEFASLKPQIDWRDGSVFMSNRHMFTFCPPVRKFFYATSCHVCRLNRTFITCEFCRMVFYCCGEHQQDDYIGHKDLCEVLTNMLNKTESMCFYNKLKGTDSETWMRGKIEIMLKAELRLGRSLMDYEEQIFLFPKACLACHESDLDVLTDCECGVSLCEEHRNDPRHENLCKEFSLAFKITASRQLPIIQANVANVKIDKSRSLPCSLDDFIENFLQFSSSISDSLVPRFQEIMMADFLTRPFTLLYAIKQLDLDINATMVIHVVGASTFEIWSQKYWKVLLFWLRNLKNLIVVFIGPEILEFSVEEVELKFSDFSLGSDQRLIVISPPVRYEDYCQHRSFIKPDIVVGFNLEIHEIKYGISSSTWKQMLLALEKLDVPFVLTAGSKERAQKDHEIMSILLERSLSYFSFELNPFVGSTPERDFETETLRYANKYVTIYDRLREGSIITE